MPQLKINDAAPIEVPAGKRLINAIVDAGTDQHYSCGGQAKCTSCRVQFVHGEPEKITQAEKDLLTANKVDLNAGIRLSCQMTCDGDMQIQTLVPKPPAKFPNRPADEIAPPPVWTTK